MTDSPWGERRKYKQQQQHFVHGYCAAPIHLSVSFTPHFLQISKLCTQKDILRERHRITYIDTILSLQRAPTMHSYITLYLNVALFIIKVLAAHAGVRHNSPSQLLNCCVSHFTPAGQTAPLGLLLLKLSAVIELWYMLRNCGDHNSQLKPLEVLRATFNDTVMKEGECLISSVTSLLPLSP